MKRKLLSTLLLSSSLLGQAAQVYAGDKSQHYAIAAGSLASALNQFAGKAGILLSADSALTEGKQSKGLAGDYTPEAALNKLLEESGLMFVRDASGNYVLRNKSVETGLSSQKDDQSIDLNAIQVIGTPQSRYDSRMVETGTRITKDVTEQDRSVDIIPEQLLLDTQARELEDVYKLAPNVVNSDGYGGTREDYLIRGFRRPADIYRNGVRLKTGRRFDPATVDNIQIIKGPVLNIGQMMPGGLVNIITKKPQLDSQHSIAANIDEHGQRRTVFDSTGALDEKEAFAYRVTGSWEDSETFRDDSQVDRRFLSGALGWFGDNGATANINYEHSREDRSMDRGHITVLNNDGQRVISDVPQSQRFDNGLGINDVTSNLFELDASMPVAENWDLQTRLLYNTEDASDSRYEVRTVLDDGTLVRRLQGNDDRQLDTWFGRLQAVGETELMVPMKIAAGVEYHQQKEDWINYFGGNQVGGSVTNPGSFTLVNDIDTASKDKRSVNMKSYGPFAQIDAELTPDITATLGLREEFYSASFSRVVLSDGATTEARTRKDSKLTKGAGLVWKVMPELSLFGSYSDTFMAQNIYTGRINQVDLDPQEGRQYEVGMKWSGFDDRVLFTAAYFDIEQTNVIETVNGNPELTGGIETSGFEFSVTGNPLPGWNIRASAGLLDAEVVSENANTNGNRPRNVPEKTANLWSSYEFQDSDHPLRGLGIGGGVSYVGNRYGDSAHTFELGDYTLVDAGIWYYLPAGQTSLVRFDLGVKNLTDEEYYTASGGTYRVSVGAERTLFAGVRLEF